MWAFEWHDTTKDLILKRGEPLFYCQFDGYDPSRTIKLMQAEKTPELMQYMEQISGVVNYVYQTFSLFNEVGKFRLSTLLTLKKLIKFKEIKNEIFEIIESSKIFLLWDMAKENTELKIIG